MAKITWADRTNFKTPLGALYEATANIYNTLKASVNSLYSDKKTWYVSKNGDNSNIGSTKAEPFLTIAAALAAMQSGDVIEILDTSATYTENLTISSSLTSVIISSRATNTETGPAVTIAGVWDLDGNNIYFNNLTVTNTWDRATDFNLTLTGCRLTTIFLDRLANLTLNASHWTLNNDSNIESLTANNSTIINDASVRTIKAATFVRLHQTDIEGGVEAGLASSSDCILKNSSITGALTVTGTLEPENSTVKGAISISSTISGGSRFPGQVTVHGKTIDFTATPTFNFTDGGNNQQMPVEGNVTTFATSNELNAGNYDVWLVNDATPGRTVATPTGWTLIPGGDTHDDAANAINLYQFKMSPSGLKRYIIKNM